MLRLSVVLVLRVLVRVSWSFRDGVSLVKKVRGKGKRIRGEKWKNQRKNKRKREYREEAVEGG